MSTYRKSPPAVWVPDAVEIDAEVGIYLSPSLQSDTNNPTLWHWCTKANNDAYIHSPRWLAMGTGLHTVVLVHPYTLWPSLLCTECGLHGFITEGKWIKV